MVNVTSLYVNLGYFHSSYNGKGEYVYANLGITLTILIMTEVSNLYANLRGYFDSFHSGRDGCLICKFRWLLFIRKYNR